VYELASSRCVFTIDPEPGKQNGERWLLGNPYARDALLQTAQLLSPGAIGLPTHIGSLQRHAVGTNGHHATFGVTTGVFDVPSRTYSVSVKSVAADGTITEELEGYNGAVLDIKDDRPTAEELAMPDPRDERLLVEALRQHGTALHANVPHAGIALIPDLGKDAPAKRHARALPVLRRVGAALFDSTAASRLRVQWLPSGQPVLRNVPVEGAAISIAHDDLSLLVVVGIGPQGCDIEPVMARDMQAWHDVLGPACASLFDQLVAAGEEGSQAGTRVWAAREAAAKALGNASPQIAPVAQHDSAMLWSARCNGTTTHILTFPLQLTLGLERMVAVTVTPRDGTTDPESAPRA
jgi:enediyne polyketide synthase